MKIVVNRGRTIHRGVTPGKKATFAADGTEAEPRVPPEVKKYGPGSVIDVPDAEGKNLIARGAATKYEPPAPAEGESKAAK